MSEAGTPAEREAGRTEENREFIRRAGGFNTTPAVAGNPYLVQRNFTFP